MLLRTRYVFFFSDVPNIAITVSQVRALLHYYRYGATVTLPHTELIHIYRCH